MKDIPTIIARPSIIVGDSHRGHHQLQTLYWPLKIYAKYGWRTVPATRMRSRLAPVDYVAEAFVELSFNTKTIGRCFTSAPARNTGNPGRIAEAAARFFSSHPRFVNRTSSIISSAPVQSRSGVKDAVFCAMERPIALTSG